MELDDLQIEEEEQQQQKEKTAFAEVEEEDINKWNQVVNSDGTVTRQKIQYGCIYRSVNQTMSLFIEPQDILKQMKPSEFNDYELFPNNEQMMESLPTSSPFSSYFDEKQQQQQTDSSLHLVIKNHFYL